MAVRLLYLETSGGVPLERTLIMIKPDAVRRRLVGEIIGRIERRGLTITAMKMLSVPREMAEKHYSAHRDKYFFEELVEFITSGPVVAMVVEGENAVKAVRTMMGPTDPQEAEPGTIRGDLATVRRYNVIHGSDSLETAEAEIRLWFPEAGP